MMMRRRNIEDKDLATKEELKDFVNNKMNYGLDDEHKFVFGPHYQNLKQKEMKKHHKKSKSRQTYAENTIREEKLNSKIPVPSKVMVPISSRIGSRGGYSSYIRECKFQYK